MTGVQTCALPILAENPDAYDLRKMNRPMMAAMKEVAIEKIRVCKAEGKSWLK